MRAECLDQWIHRAIYVELVVTVGLPNHAHAGDARQFILRYCIAELDYHPIPGFLAQPFHCFDRDKLAIADDLPRDGILSPRRS